ncbi:universal stress protein [Evansella sp. AB-P1]|uniref:universal stress protein n=1 Tax=Evansella sp. AB-P1 TaxID=3037653 RepID=UPI00241D2423|nr:universal stress protein [Evansella sp. AB-P1]MDG5788462.1 universal stress protein [Evansella sp. AB-P1]
MFDKILLAADGSKHSMRAAEKAIYIAKQREGAEITVIHVVDSIPSRSDVMDENMTMRKDIPEERKADTAELEKYLINENVSFKVKHVFGEPGPSIVKEANEGIYNLVVIGSRGLNPFQQFVLGSVSHKVAKRVQCPVMIVK